MDQRESNEVFTMQQAKRAGFETRSVLKDDFGIEIPVELAPLPSGGKIYSPDSPLHMQEAIEIKAMTARQEDILTSRALIKNGTVITELLKSCLVNPAIDVDSMIAGDRNALMVAIRITGYGSSYDIKSIECPVCNKKSEQSFDLSSLQVKQLNIDPILQGENVFQFQLPVSGHTVKFKYLTGKDERELTHMAERKKKLNLSKDDSVTSALAFSIVSVTTKTAEITDKTKIGMFVQSMPARDSLALRHFMEKNEPGIDMKAEMSCPHCSEESEVRLPLEASFFWPDR